MDEYGGAEIQNEPPLFLPCEAFGTPAPLDDAHHHSVFCEIYVYDYFQNKRCVFKGLGKILAPPREPEVGPSPERERERERVRRADSAHGRRLKRFSYSRHPNLFRESNIINVVTDDANDSDVSNGDPDVSVSVSRWRRPSAASGERDSFGAYVEIEDFANISNGPSDGAEGTDRLDYETLLPRSVVESNSLLTTLSSERSDREAMSADYANAYRGLFERPDEIGDDEVERKRDLDEYLDYGNDDETYFLTDISNSTRGSKRDSFSSNRSAEVACEICNRKCRSINALNHHMLVHSEERPFACEICKKAFKEQPTLRRHMWTHMDKQHQCDICEKYFVEKSSLRRHISTIHADFKPGARCSQGNAKQHFNCVRCGKVFKSHAKFTIHHGMHGNPNFECDVCGKVYAGRSHLKIHQRIHTGEKPYACNMCDMKFAFKHVLKSHQARIHQKIHKFKCNVCLLTFIKKSELSSHAGCHMLNMKKNKRNYVSRKNSKKYAASSSLKVKGGKRADFDVPVRPMSALFRQLIDAVHDKYKSDDDHHPDVVNVDKSDSIDDGKDGLCKSPNTLIDQGKKNKECLECNKTFERMGDLKRHLISHIVENINKKAREDSHSVPVYECELCFNNVFKQVDKFKKHLREHAKLTLYQCQICDRAFGDSSNFSKHKKVHGESYLKCTICNRKFNTKRMMVAHMNYHRENKPKTCQFCMKLFHFESNLRKHVKIAHTTKGKMTYRCEECGDRFVSVRLKWEHQWEVHKMRKVNADCHMCSAQFRKISLLRAHIIKEHTTLVKSKI